MPETSWFRIGHTTMEDECSGCTAIIFDRLVPAAVDVRGGAPGTRETTLLDRGSIGMLDAILLSGGSAFGLQGADGVMRYLAEHGRGVVTRAGNVPLVSSAIIFDLGVGSIYHPTPDDAYEAARTASATDRRTGRVGAGAGATVAKLGGSASHAGLGIADIEIDGYTITAVTVLNAVGDVRDPASGEWLATCGELSARDLAIQAAAQGGELENTTIGAVLVTGDVDRRTLHRCCISAQAAVARCTVPAHTMLDGDTFYAAASELGTPTVQQSLAITAAVEMAVEESIRSIFRP